MHYSLNKIVYFSLILTLQKKQAGRQGCPAHNLLFLSNLLTHHSLDQT